VIKGQAHFCTIVRNLQHARLSLLTDQLKDFGDAEVLEIASQCDCHD
jgi:hypothetical protein